MKNILEGLDNDIKKTANIFISMGYCDRLWVDPESEHDEMDEECGGLYLVNGKGIDEELEYMSPLLDLGVPSMEILSQLTCLEQFFEIDVNDPVISVRQAILKDVLSNWDGVLPEEVKPYRQVISLL